MVIHPSQKRFLHFVIGLEHDQYHVLPFGLSMALSIFMKVLSAVAAHLHQRGITVFPYLDDWLLRRFSAQEAQSATNKVLALFQSLGLHISLKKPVSTNPTDRL